MLPHCWWELIRLPMGRANGGITLGQIHNDRAVVGVNPQARIRAWRLIASKAHIGSSASIEPLEITDELCFWPNLL